ncbi:MAG: pentapeptide repeat-containing protein [Candidatus Micrarchaeota archaeon]|nr:pentapeptide repeat-containing protein [Candidatus Micrarchaeota archaeon]
MRANGQTAIEFLSTYGFTFLIIALVLLFLILYTSLPKTILPFQCTFYNAFSCHDLIYINLPNDTGSQLIILASAGQIGVVNFTSFNASINNIHSTSGYCTPNTVIPGERFFCVANFSTVGVQGELYDGVFSMSAGYCANSPSSLNNYSCPASNSFIYGGSFRTESSPSKPPVLVTFAISQMQDPKSDVLGLDGANYVYGQLPLTMTYKSGTGHTLFYNSTVLTGGNTIYTFHSVSGCGITTEGAYFVASQSCTITATYLGLTYRSCQLPHPPNHEDASYCYVGGYDMSGESIVQSNFSHAYLVNANMTGTNFNQGVNFEYADLEYAIITNANFHNVDLKGANLGNVIGISTYFRSANLSYTYMVNGYFVGSDFSSANLSYANMQNADFANAKFRGANLAYANLNGANITGASFSGAYTQGCTGCP